MDLKAYFERQTGCSVYTLLPGGGGGKQLLSCSLHPYLEPERKRRRYEIYKYCF